MKPEQVTDFYAKNPDQFKQGESVRASHFDQRAQRRRRGDEAQARAKAEQVLQRSESRRRLRRLAKALG